MSSIDLRPTRAAPDDDPYLWLEDIEGGEACAWADARSAETLAKLADARFDADRAALLAIFDRPDRIAHVRRRGAFLYNFWRDAAQPRGLWRRTTMESYRREQPDWELLLDLDALAAKEGEDWVWSRAETRPPRHDRAMLSLSRGGADAVVLREFDLTRRDFVAGGFSLPEAKGGVSWPMTKRFCCRRRSARETRRWRAMREPHGYGRGAASRRRRRPCSKWRRSGCPVGRRSIARTIA